MVEFTIIGVEVVCAGSDIYKEVVIKAGELVEHVEHVRLKLIDIDDHDFALVDIRIGLYPHEYKLKAVDHSTLVIRHLAHQGHNQPGSQEKN